jgi:glutathione S-transferase
LTDGDISIFESGAILLPLGGRSDALMPTDPRRSSEAREWLFAALNSVEMASLPWSLLVFSGDAGNSAAWRLFADFLKAWLIGRARMADRELLRRRHLDGGCAAPS